MLSNCVFDMVCNSECFQRAQSFRSWLNLFSLCNVALIRWVDYHSGSSKHMADMAIVANSSSSSLFAVNVAVLRTGLWFRGHHIH